MVLKTCHCVISLTKVEKSESCQRVIRARQAEGHFRADAPLFGDIQSFEMDSADLSEPPVGMTGGFPCQARHCVNLEFKPCFKNTSTFCS